MVLLVTSQDAAPAKGSEQHKWLGRLRAKDVRDANYQIPHLLSVRTQRFWYLHEVLNQGETPMCVAYGTCGWLLAGPVVNAFPGLRPFDPAYAEGFYKQAQALDEWPGEDYDGTSVRGGMKALKARGLVSGYSWSQSAEVLAAWVLEKSPVVVGTDWLEGMDTPFGGFLSASGPNMGGHCWVLIGYSANKACPDHTKGAFRMQNSWGKTWGTSGRAWISKADMQKLLDADGEAATATEVDLG